MVGSAMAMLALAGVAHSSGSGWVQAIGTLLTAVLVIGLVAPLFPARRATATCSASPADGEAGQPITVTMVATGPIRIKPRYPMGPAVRAAGSPHGSRVVDVTFTPERRGVVDHVVVEAASCAPFGLLWWAREIEVALSRPLHVAPRTGQPGPIASVADGSAGDAPPRVVTESGGPRGIRPYQPGDSRRSVHWPATSHVGSLMVRVNEHQTDDPAVVEVVLPADPLEAEGVTEQVMASVGHYLARGEPVILVTQEPEGRTVRLVHDRIDLGRRLARAVPLVVPAEAATQPGLRSGLRRRKS